MINTTEAYETIKETAKMAAEAIQNKSDAMTGTELNEEVDFIPDFRAAIETMNMLVRPVGFVCKSSAGRVVKLIQNYDSTIYTAEPEELPAQYGFVWSNDPKHALPFIALSTSPYNTGNCCTENDIVYRSKMEGNVHAPSAYPQGWELVTE